MIISVLDGKFIKRFLRVLQSNFPLLYVGIITDTFIIVVNQLIEISNPTFYL